MGVILFTSVGSLSARTELIHWTKDGGSLKPDLFLP